MKPRTLRRVLQSRLAVVPAALLLLLVAACTGADPGDDAPQEATATRTVVGTLPTMEPTPAATGATATGTTASGAASPGMPSEGAPGTGTGEGDAYGVATVAVETGTVAVLYEDEAPPRPAVSAGFAPWPAARHGAIWLSPSREEAVRYALDGTVEERLAGWGVLESGDASVRSYFRTDEGGGVSLVIERGGDEVATTDGGNASNRAFSPDGRWLAWLDTADEERHQILLLDLDTGEVTEAATVGPCRCDGFHYINWSPSGRYLAYADPGPEASGASIYLYEVAAPEAERQGIVGNHVRDGWIEIDAAEYLLTVEGQTPWLTPALSATQPALQSTAQSAANGTVDAERRSARITFDVGSPSTSILASTLQGLIVVTHGRGASPTTMIFDPVSGERLREVQGTSDAVLTPDGIATATITRNDIACTGIEVDHPAMEEILECTAEYLRWSPDGRYLALIPQAQSAAVEVLDVTTGTSQEVPHVGPRGTVPEWSEDGRYLVWVWGG